MMPGGATVVVANQPRTGDHVSITTTLMPGAPRIRYCKTCIVYNYNECCITLDFGLCGDSEPHMVYHRDDSVSTHVQNEIRSVRQTTKGFISASGLPTPRKASGNVGRTLSSQRVSESTRRGQPSSGEQFVSGIQRQQETWENRQLARTPRTSSTTSARG